MSWGSMPIPKQRLARQAVPRGHRGTCRRSCTADLRRRGVGSVRAGEGGPSGVREDVGQPSGPGPEERPRRLRTRCAKKDGNQSLDAGRKERDIWPKKRILYSITIDRLSSVPVGPDCLPATHMFRRLRRPDTPAHDEAETSRNKCPRTAPVRNNTADRPNCNCLRKPLSNPNGKGVRQT